jgi:hypothetical protein
VTDLALSGEHDPGCNARAELIQFRYNTLSTMTKVHFHTPRAAMAKTTFLSSDVS